MLIFQFWICLPTEILFLIVHIDIVCVCIIISPSSFSQILHNWWTHPHRYRPPWSFHQPLHQLIFIPNLSSRVSILRLKWTHCRLCRKLWMPLLVPPRCQCPSFFYNLMTGVPGHQWEKLREIDGAISVSIDLVDHVLQLGFRGVLSEWSHNSSQFLHCKKGTLVVIDPSPFLSKRANASLNSAICSSLSWSAIFFLNIYYG